MAVIDEVVTAAWLSANLGRPGIRVLDSTWALPGDQTSKSDMVVPGTSFFDIDEIADKTSEFSHMLPSRETFENAVSGMGIHNNDHIIVYDQHGIFSSPRVWWAFKMFGHEKISVLDGGLLAWLEGSYPTEKSCENSRVQSNYQARAPLSKIISCGSISADRQEHTQIIDARSSGRFYGRAPEPRAGLRSGHIPGSFSMPYQELLRPDKRFIDFGNIAEKFGEIGIDFSKPIITSCGSGITAAILALCLNRLGAKDVSLYDGSWAEWGASTLPVSLGD